MNDFLNKFLYWNPIWQTTFLVGPLAIYILDNEIGLLPDFPSSTIIYGIFLFSSLILSLVWPLSIERILLTKTQTNLRNDILKELPKKGAKIFFFILMSTLIVAIFFALPFFEEALTPKGLYDLKSNEDVSQIKNTLGETAKIAGVIVLIMLTILILFLIQILIYAKLAWRSAIILNSIERNRVVLRNESKKEFWLFLFVPLGVWLLNKRILNVLNSEESLSQNESIIDL